MSLAWLRFRTCTWKSERRSASGCESGRSGDGETDTLLSALADRMSVSSSLCSSSKRRFLENGEMEPLARSGAWIDG